MPVLRIAPRALATVLVAAAALIALAAVMPGVELRRTWAALAAVALIGLVNTLVWPLLVRLALPFAVFTLGPGTLLLNGGGPQTTPFVLFPATLPPPEEPIVGAEAVHHLLRGWLARLGHDAYADEGEHVRVG